MFRKVLYTLVALVGAIFITGWVLAFLPTPSKVNTKRITREEAAMLRQQYTEAYHTFSATDEGKKGVTTPPTFFQKTKILASSIFRPSVPIVEYYREGMTGMDDSLFNFKYTLQNLKFVQFPIFLFLWQYQLVADHILSLSLALSS